MRLAILGLLVFVVTFVVTYAVVMARAASMVTSGRLRKAGDE